MLTTTRERRTFMRMVVNAPVTLVRGEERMLATCRDLSANGMAIEADSVGDFSVGDFSVGEVLKVNLSTNSNALPPFVADAKIVRADKTGKFYQLGLEFVTVG